jgi:ElaB/YqjD/DUF883 family membrane-anchored ribosome-binding protein
MAKVSGGAQAKGKRVPGQEAQQSASDVNRIREDVETLAKSVGSAAGHQYERAQQLAKDSLTRSENVVRRNPFSAILASVGLGFLLGLFRGGRK